MASGGGLDETKYTLVEHLGELRSRLLRSMLAVIVTTSACLFVAPQLLDYSIRPLRAVLEDRARVETVVLHADGARAAALAGELSKDARVRVRGTATALSEVGRLVDAAREARRPVDLVLVASTAIANDGARVSDLLEEVDPTPFVVYLVSDARDPMAAELRLDGAVVIRDPPRAAVLRRVVRQAAGAAGKGAGGDKLVVLSPLEPFFAYLKIALVVGLFLACPVWLFQAWRFIAPGLYRNERRIVAPVVLSGSTLFVAGGAFAYYVMFPLMFDVLVNQMMPETLAGAFTVDKYLGLLLQMTVAFGLVFELPLALALLSAVGVVSAQGLRRFRKYAVIGAFVLGAVLTPTADPVSQVLMAAPLIVFYEVGIVLAATVARRRTESAETSGAAHVEGPAR